MKKIFLLSISIIALSWMGCKNNSSSQVACTTNCGSSSNDTLLAPTSVTATAVSSTEIDLTWTPKSYKSTYQIQIEMKSETDTDFSTLETVADDETSFDASGLTLGKTYFFRLKAVAGTDSSAYSTVADATTTTGTISAAYPKPSIDYRNSSTGYLTIYVNWSNADTPTYVNPSDMLFQFRKTSETTWHDISLSKNNGASSDTKFEYFAIAAPSPGPIVFRVKVEYTTSGLYISPTSATMIAKLEVPTSLAATNVTTVSGTKKHSLTWDYGTPPGVMSGFKLNATIDSGADVGPTTLIPKANKTYTYIPSSCPTGKAVKYTLIAKSDNSLVADSDASAAANISCP